MKTLLTVFALSTLAFAQVDRATVTGTLRDPAGAVIAGGGVTVTYPETGQHRTVSSNGSGVFLAPGLPVGHVIVDASKAGFRTIRVETDLNVGETKTLGVGRGRQ